MTYKGRVRKGVVVLDDAVTLPEGSVVRVEMLDPAEGVDSLRRGLREIAGTVDGLPEDLAENYDHYVHGTPRK